MAATFRPVNTPFPEPSTAAIMTPSPATPRPNTAPHGDALRPADDATTPTRANFPNTMNGQKPLPTSPFPQAVQIPDSAANRPKRDDSQHSTKSSRRDSVDVDMDDSDGETGTIDEEGGSDDDSVNADGSRSGKKKKSQRFYCTDYPPCNLSFTRSEHLARHIRKHTGERPFQCHCSRRFSRLDNLRQHAQTVHVNEDIPIDSLAASGSRFQRQIRTDRVRQAGNRARASTGGSAGGPVRGHSKSLSTSSIASIGSVSSVYNVQPDPRRRPPPLVMADPRQRLSLESYRSNADSAYTSYRPPSPGEFSTPTSATYSTGQSSPRWSGARTPGRRLSVPSGANPFQSPHGSGQMRPMFGSGAINTSNIGAYSPANSSLVSSPTASTSGWSARRDSTSSAAEEAWRRRTWHPDSRTYVYPPNPSQLSNVVSQSVRPNPAPPIANPSGPQAGLRLPGIESFDPVPRRPLSPPRRQPSPMVIDAEPAPRSALQPPTLEATPIDDRRNLNLYDASLQRGLNRLDINHTTPPRDSAGAWASEVHKAVQAQAEQSRLNPPVVRFEDQQGPPYANHSMGSSRSFHHQTMSAPSITASRESKRHGWYNGPVMQQRESPPQQGQHDPRVAHVDRIVHPNFQGFSGFPGRNQGAPQQQQDRSATTDPLGRLEALVAVATNLRTTHGREPYPALTLARVQQWNIETCPLCEFFLSMVYANERDTCDSILVYRYSSALRNAATNRTPGVPKHEPRTALSIEASGSGQSRKHEPIIANISKLPETPALLDRDRVNYSALIVWIDKIRATQREPMDVLPVAVIDCHTRRVVSVPGPLDYVALSYVWGPVAQGASPRGKTLPDNLPLTVEDAMAVVKELGLRDLWVDRYCLDQADKTEFQAQLNLIADIYRHALVTITAPTGSDASYGLPGVSCRSRINQPRLILGDYTLWSSMSDPRAVMYDSLDGNEGALHILLGQYTQRNMTYQSDALNGALGLLKRSVQGHMYGHAAKTELMKWVAIYSNADCDVLIEVEFLDEATEAQLVAQGSIELKGVLLRELDPQSVKEPSADESWAFALVVREDAHGATRVGSLELRAENCSVQWNDNVHHEEAKVASSWINHDLVTYTKCNICRKKALECIVSRKSDAFTKLTKGS
ncbi:C2H2 finger domain transcription factor dvrA [Paramyrothecium foliicola]|nr:C2H2 finger domain transcription factor dvrA [Paramyrothecium foliicola]